MKKLFTLLALALLTALSVHAQFSGSVPRMDINIENGDTVKDKVNWLNAKVSIQGNGFCPDFKEMDVTIRGRGNSSWTTPSRFNPDPKNPYRLKFDKKQSLAGLKKGKNWVLLANSQDNSMLTNAYGMALARIVGTLAANDIIPVDLYINGDYRGNYNLTEKVGISANSIDVDNEDKAVLIEMDTYYDEDYKFHDKNYYRLPVMIKDPDLSEKDVQVSLPQIEDSITALTAEIKMGNDISDRVDTTMLAKYMLVNFLICNQEILHPKSTYLFREVLDDSTSKWQFGPVWDLDWAYGYQQGYGRWGVEQGYGTVDYDIDFFSSARQYGMENIQFWEDLMKIPCVQEAYYREWRKFMNSGGLDSLMAYCKNYYDLVKPSLQRDCDKWNYGKNNYDEVYTNMTTWLNNRAKYMYNEIVATGISAVNGGAEPGKAVKTSGVYNMNGQKVADNPSASLPHGIYVIDGRKVVR